MTIFLHDVTFIAFTSFSISRKMSLPKNTANLYWRKTISILFLMSNAWYKIACAPTPSYLKMRYWFYNNVYSSNVIYEMENTYFSISQMRGRYSNSSSVLPELSRDSDYYSSTDLPEPSNYSGRYKIRK